MVTIREYKPSDFDEVLNMYYQLCHEIYPHRTFKSMRAFESNVKFWISSNYDIMVTENNGRVTGFILCYVDNMGGIVDDYYQIECVYVKHDARNSRALQLMVATAMNYANTKGYILSGNASEFTQASDISSRFGLKILTRYERLPNGKN
jgi:hypothetical protein